MARDPMDPNWVEASRRGMTRRMAAGNPELTAAVAAGPGEFVDTSWGADAPPPTRATGGIADTPLGQGVRKAAEAYALRQLSPSAALDTLSAGAEYLFGAPSVPSPSPSAPDSAPGPEPVFAEPGRGKMTNAYGVPMAVSNQNGVPTFTDSAYDPLHYGVNATGPAGAGFNEWAEANPYAAQQFAADTSSGMQRRANRIAGENEAAMQQALLLQMPDLPARNLEAQAKMLEAETAAAQAGGQDAVNKNAKALSDLFDATVARNKARGLSDAEAHSAAIMEHLRSSVEQGIDPLQFGAIESMRDELQRSLLSETDDQSYLDPFAMLPGTGVNAPWDKRGVFEERDPETGELRALPSLSEYDVGSDPWTHTLYDQEGSQWGWWPQSHGWALGPRALSDNVVISRRGEGGLTRRGNMDLPAGMDRSTFAEMLRLLQEAEAARAR